MLSTYTNSNCVFLLYSYDHMYINTCRSIKHLQLPLHACPFQYSPLFEVWKKAHRPCLILMQKPGAYNNTQEEKEIQDRDRRRRETKVTVILYRLESQSLIWQCIKRLCRDELAEPSFIIFLSNIMNYYLYKLLITQYWVLTGSKQSTKPSYLIT